MDYVLGTANLGLPYGKALARELPDEDRVSSILSCAEALGISWLDTAAAYGKAQARIGRYFARTPGRIPFRVSSKLPPVLNSDDAHIGVVVQEIITSLQDTLGHNRIDQLLLHRWSQYCEAGNGIWTTLCALRQAGYIGRLGASIQNSEEAIAALNAPGIETMQLACNILDWRYDEPEIASLLVERPIRIEIRSVFLQGLLTHTEGVRFPTTAESYDAGAIRSFLALAANELAQGDIVALCLRYVAGLGWADAIVFGVDNCRQLEEIMAALSAGPFPADVMHWIRSQRPYVPASFLDPAQWA